MSGCVDLDAVLRVPGAPDDERPDEMARAAQRGGVDLVVVGIDGQAPIDDVSLGAIAATLRAASATTTLIPAVSPLVDGHLADLGSLRWRRALEGVPLTRPVWRLREAVDDALLLRRIGELARAHDALVLVPPLDAALSAGAVAVEGAVATKLGLPALPEAAEAIALARLVEIARLTGGRFHVLGVWTGAGAAIVERSDGLLSGSVRATHLLFDESALLLHRYETQLLRWPPLPTASSREQLVEAVRRGSLLVGSGHVAVPRRERELEMIRATPGGTALASTARLLLPLLGQNVLQVAWRDGPRRLLGLPAAEGALSFPALAVDGVAEYDDGAALLSLLTGAHS
jgi:dihydroorotase